MFQDKVFEAKIKAVHLWSQEQWQPWTLKFNPNAYDIGQMTLGNKLC